MGKKKTEKKPSAKKIAKKIKDEVRAKLLKMFDDYADEAEHQDGYWYWEDNFNNNDEIITDFVAYVEETQNLERESYVQEEEQVVEGDEGTEGEPKAPTERGPETSPATL